MFEEEPAEGGKVSKWLWGYIFPALVLVVAVWGIADGRVYFFYGSGAGKYFTGAAGCFLAISYVGFAAWWHFHWGWGLSHRLWPHVATGKRAAWCVFVPSILLFMFFAFRS
jgi:hypothetical protein